MSNALMHTETGIVLWITPWIIPWIIPCSFLILLGEALPEFYSCSVTDVNRNVAFPREEQERLLYICIYIIITG